MLERVLVAAIVLVACCYSAWRLWPARSRLALLRRLDRSAAGMGGRVIHRLRLRAEAASGCDACPRDGAGNSR